MKQYKEGDLVSLDLNDGLKWIFSLEILYDDEWYLVEENGTLFLSLDRATSLPSFKILGNRFKDDFFKLKIHNSKKHLFKRFRNEANFLKKIIDRISRIHLLFCKSRYYVD